MNMFDKKDPRQESVKLDSSEDEVIIDLTDEITVESENDNDTIDLTGETDDDPPIIAKGDKAEEDKENDEFEEMTGAMDLDEEDDDPHDMTGIFDLDDFDVDDDDDPEEDAKATDLAAEADDDDPNDMTGVFDLDDLDVDDPEENAKATDLVAEADDDDPHDMTGIFDLDDLDVDDPEEDAKAMDLAADDDPHDVTGIFDLDDLNDDLDDDKDEMTMVTDLDDLDDDKDEMTMVTDLDDFDDDKDDMTMVTDLDDLDDDKDDMTMVTDLDDLDDDKDDMTMVTDLDDFDDIDDDKDEMTMVTDLDDFDDDKDEMAMVTDLDDFDDIDDDKDEMTMVTDLDDFDDIDDDKDEMTMVTDLDDFDDDKDEMTMVTDLDDLDDDKDEMTMVTDLDNLDDDNGEMTMVTDLDDFDDDKDEMTMVTDLDDFDDDKDEMTMVTDLDDLDDDKDEMAMVTDLDDFDDIDDDKDEMTMVTDLDDLDDDKGEMTMVTDLDDLDKLDDDTEEMTEVRDLADFDDDTIIVDNSPDQTGENNSAAVGSPAGTTGWNEDLFDLEENTDPEFELDDEENELIELDEERGEDDHDFADMMLAVATETKEGEAARAPEKYLDFENDDRDDVIDLESDQDQEAEFVSLTEDGIPEFINRDGLPDIEALSDIDFNEEDSAGQETEELEVAGGDDIIARAVEKSLSLNDGFRKADQAGEAESERENDDALLDLGGSPETSDKSLSLVDEDHPKSEFVDNLLHMKEQADIEENDEVIALDSNSGYKDKDGEEIIEITEFDQHFSADEEITLNQTGMVNPSKADEDDFIELIEVEEDSPFEEKGLIEFSDSPPESGEAEINPLLSNEIDPDFISRQVDPINQISPQDGTVEIEIALSPVDQVAEKGKKDDTVLEELKVGQAIDELSTIPTGDINAAVEQILNEKFADRIEAIIYDVIEKAVAKEIDRLKRALLGNDTIDNFEP